MSIDKQHIAAVTALEALGFKYTSDGGWLPPINSGCAIGEFRPISPRKKGGNRSDASHRGLRRPPRTSIYSNGHLPDRERLPPDRATTPRWMLQGDALASAPGAPSRVAQPVA